MYHHQGAADLEWAGGESEISQFYHSLQEKVKGATSELIFTIVIWVCLFYVFVYCELLICLVFV